MKLRRYDLYKAIRKEIKSNQNVNFSSVTCLWNPTFVKIKEVVAQFKLATKHDCLAKHLHRFGFINDNKSNICNMGKILNEVPGAE
mgnify:CR=1 FL=1